MLTCCDASCKEYTGRRRLNSSRALLGSRRLNRSMSLDRIILATVRETAKWLLSRMEREDEPLMDHLAYFISWDLEWNQPKIIVDGSGSYVETMWLA